MSDLDVSMRLQLQQQVDKEGKKAEKALLSLSKTAKALGRIDGVDDLAKNLKKVDRVSDKTAKELKKVKAAGDKLQQVNTNKAEKEINELRKAAARAEDRYNRLIKKQQKINKVAASGKAQALVNPMNALASSAGRLVAGLGAAFTANEIIRGMDKMRVKAEQLEEQLTRLLLIEGEVSPEKRAARQKRNEELAIRFGLTQEQVLSARNVLAQGDIVGETQENALQPILKTAKASGSDTAVIAQASRALLQNLELPVDQLSRALDIMLAGGKAGAFELEDMARFFPSLAAVHANGGRLGIDAVTELTAMAQIVRENQGDSSQAGTALVEILAKVFSPEVIKRFSENGVNVKKVAKQAEKDDIPLVLALADIVKKKGLDDQFGLGELIGDKNAREALVALTSKQDKFKSLQKELRTSSQGTVDKDFKTIDNLGKTRTQRREAALESTSRSIGETTGPIISRFMDSLVRKVNPEFDRQLKFEKTDTSKISEKIKKAREKLANLEANRSNLSGADFQIADAKAAVSRLEGLLKTVQRVQGLAAPAKPVETNAGKNNIPVPQINPKRPFAPFQSALEKALTESKEKVGAAVRDMQNMLNFNASPTITPIIQQPSGASTNLQKSSFSNSSTFNINGSSSPQKTARAITRKQNQQIRATRAGALHDTGSFA